MFEISKLFSATCPALTTRMVVWVITLTTAPVLLFVELQSFTPGHTLFRDPLSVAQSDPSKCCEPYFGFVSLLGSSMWAASAAVCLLAWLIIRRLNDMNEHSIFFFVGFLLSSALFFDDTFMIHETVLPRHGWDEKWGYAFLAILAGVYLYAARFVFFRRSGIMLLAALTFLSTSALLDLTKEISYLYEDGLKFIGIATWTVFHFSIVIEEFYLGFQAMRTQSGNPAIGHGNAHRRAST